ncbi:alpha/beta fold hydrolase [Streptomyces sp. NPDC059564]|uniref:alpha/beta fold hydrolase n=1 Tax=Streptomyces sp. NPDC059564 TaxID=3346865 RepID=UPI00369E989C
MTRLLLNAPVPCELSFTRRGAGRPYLLLHGGAGPQSVEAFAELLASDGRTEVITPTHPGFGGTDRPEGLDGMGGLAALYGELLDRLHLRDVTVIGNSIGGWTAAELALLHSPRVRAVVLVDAVGIEVDGEPVADVFALSPQELSRLSRHRPLAPEAAPAPPTPQQRAAMAGNRDALAVYGGGPSMTDPHLRDRLAAVTVPALVLWGESDGIVTPAYGRAYAAAIPGARFALLPGAGHLPQLETPDRLHAEIDRFTANL